MGSPSIYLQTLAGCFGSYGSTGIPFLRLKYLEYSELDKDDSDESLLNDEILEVELENELPELYEDEPYKLSSYSSE